MTLKPEDMGSRLAEIERRLRIVETATPSAFTSISDDDGNELVRLSREGLEFFDASGNLIVRQGPDGVVFYDAAGNVIVDLSDVGLLMRDAAGTLRARIGYINSTVGYGVAVYEEGGGQLFEANNDGFRFPALNTPWIPLLSAFSVTATPITSASFQSVYQAEFSSITHGGFASTVVCTSDVGTTGEFRILADAGGNTSAVTVPSGSGGTGQAFEWLHGLDIGVGPTSFRVQARRTGGAGNVYVYLPARASMIDPLVCSGTGL